MFFGIAFLLLGITIVFNSFQGLTGFAIYENVDVNVGIAIGVWFVLSGIMLALYRKSPKSS